MQPFAEYDGRTMPRTKPILKPPVVELIGDIDHRDFRDAMATVRAHARAATATIEAPELILVAQSRPGTIGGERIERLRRERPLAGIVALLGSWCEGETRTGRPWPGVERLYWYEFPAWWRRQLALRAAGHCPDWAQPESRRYRAASHNEPRRTRPRTNAGLVVLRASHDTATAIAAVLHRAGFSSASLSSTRSTAALRGAVAGIWDGRQLSEREADDFAKFCRRLGSDAAPVVALLDFPRRDRVNRAVRLGAAAVVGKPWINAELIATVQSVVEKRNVARAA
jgi:hypothetical protein